MTYTTASHTIFHNRYHLVWITKYRYKVLTEEIRLRIREITRQICEQLGVKIIKGVLVQQPYPYVRGNTTEALSQ